MELNYQRMRYTDATVFHTFLFDYSWKS